MSELDTGARPLATRAHAPDSYLGSPLWWLWQVWQRGQLFGVGVRQRLCGTEAPEFWTYQYH